MEPPSAVGSANLQILITGFVALCGTIIAPVLLNYLNNRSRTKEKQQDAEIARQQKQDENRRQDQLDQRSADRANAAAASASLLIEQNAAIAKKQEEAVAIVAQTAEQAAVLLKANNQAVAITAAETKGQLMQIHTLVNSSLTKSIKANLVALKGQRAALLENNELNRAAGREQNPDTMAAIAAIGSEITELDSTLADRMKQQDMAANEAQIAANKVTQIQKE